LAQGTVDYCSPEQRHGLPTDARSDLFSLATMAYEVLTGRLPGRVFVPASERNPRLPSAADEVLRRGLARGPEGRYRTVEEFRADLNAALGPHG
jgi:serine/threonine-protein kinase